MNRILSCSVVACLLIAGGAAAIARSPQDGTAVPGQPTQARVWIQNRGDAEAIPVSIHEAAVLRVEFAAVPKDDVEDDVTEQLDTLRAPFESPMWPIGEDGGGRQVLARCANCRRTRILPR